MRKNIIKSMIKSMIFNEKNHDFSQKKPLIGFLEPKISI